MKKGKILRRILVLGLILIILSGLFAGCGNTLSGKYYERYDDGSLETEFYIEFKNDNTFIIYSYGEKATFSYEMKGNIITLQLPEETVILTASDDRKQLFEENHIYVSSDKTHKFRKYYN